jgi:hypothetical protein
MEIREIREAREIRETAKTRNASSDQGREQGMPLLSSLAVLGQALA